MLRTEAISSFLKTIGNSHLTDLYNFNMETQVNVAQDNGTPINDIYKGKRWRGWRGPDGTIWKSFRIPLNADTLPQYTDKEQIFDLAAHVEGIGMTGWDWQNRESLWVGFDFDSIANHKAGLSQETLDSILNILLGLKYTTIVKSTSGKGYHVYIHFSRPIKTDNHTYHAALARSLLGYLTMETGYDFKADVDVCGGILWVYHRKQEGTDGLSLIKKGETFDVSKLPPNWMEHIQVTAKKRKKVALKQDISELSTSQSQVLLDEDHNRVLKWFTQKGAHDFWWDADHNMLVCHTLDLAQAHVDLGLKGIFFTASTGSSTQNCFCFPCAQGSWTVRRHGKGVKEHPYWTTDNSGWTRCVFNASAPVEAAAKTNRGIRNTKGEYVFNDHKNGLLAVKHMGIDIAEVTAWLDSTYGATRTLRLKTKGESLIISIQRLNDSESQPEGFLLNKDFWEIIVDLPKEKRELNIPDELIRHCISNSAEAGWFVRTQGTWVSQSRVNVSTVLIAQDDFERGDIELLMGKCILNPWRLVNKPFLDEYPGNREWNKDSACFKVQPLEGQCATWLKVVEHCGSSLSDSVRQHPWCVDNGIRTGGEYLLCWFASLLQAPDQPLPYLCFWGEQNTGKSTLHEAIDSFILKKGYSRADYALTNPTGFNAEIAHSVLCVVEETDLRVNKEAANRIKDWVTGRTISIREMYRNTYDINNTTHWIQCTNDLNYCIILPGDTRIVPIRVDRPSEEIPKQVLFNRLEAEAAAFLHLLLNIEVPRSPSRLAIPVLHTFEKGEVEAANKTPLERFIGERCSVVKGHTVNFDQFFMSFLDWLSPSERGAWNKNKMARDFPKTGLVCKGKYGSQNETVVGNLSLDPEATELDFYFKVNSFNGRLEQVNEHSN